MGWRAECTPPPISRSHTLHYITALHMAVIKSPIGSQASQITLGIHLNSCSGFLLDCTVPEYYTGLLCPFSLYYTAMELLSLKALKAYS